MTQQELWDQFWGYYYGKHYTLGHHPREAHEDAADEIRKLDLTRLDIEDGRVIIRLRRPGLLIGPKGDNIVALQDYLKLANNDENLKVHIEEETEATIADQLIPWYYDPEDLY